MFADQTKGAVLFLFSLIVGAALGLVYDLMRLLVTSLPDKTEGGANEKQRLTVASARAILLPLKPRFTLNSAACFISDVLFCTVSALAVTVLLFHLNYGRVRVFSLVSAVTGYMLYRKTLGVPIRDLLKKLLRLMKKALCFFASVTVKPLTMLILMLFRPIADKLGRKMARKKAARVLTLMQENEKERLRKRKINNERNTGASYNGNGKGTVLKG